MRCGRCQSLMTQTHQELNTASKQARYKCPLCGRTQLVFEPLNRHSAEIGTNEPPLRLRLSTDS
jgi:transposase-like protein